MKDQINYIAGEVSRDIGMILKALGCFKKDALMTRYHSLTYPYLTYCSDIWGSTYQSNLIRFERLQNYDPKNYLRCQKERIKHCLLRLADINKYLISRPMFRVYNNHVPHMSLSLFKQNLEFHNYPDSIIHGANMGPTWVLSAPVGPHVGPMNLAIRVYYQNCGSFSPYASTHWSW